MKRPNISSSRGFIEFIILGVVLAVFITLWILDRTVFKDQDHGELGTGKNRNRRGDLYLEDFNGTSGERYSQNKSILRLIERRA